MLILSLPMSVFIVLFILKDSVARTHASVSLYIIIIIIIMGLMRHRFFSFFF